MPDVVTHPFFDHPTPVAIAHRGGLSEHPENTLPAFVAAHELGFRYLETDVHLTADGVVVAFHDDKLDRVTNGRGAIADRSLAELAEIEVGSGGRIPTLDDLLSALPSARFNIDPKSDAVLEPLIEVLRQHQAMSRVCVGAFSDARLARARRLAGPQLATSLGPRDVAKLLAASAARRVVSRLPRFEAHAAQVPVRQNRLPIVTESFVDTAHRAGLAVQVWTIDDPSEMNRLLDLGVDGIMTDHPSRLRDVLVERGEWHEPNT